MSGQSFNLPPLPSTRPPLELASNQKAEASTDRKGRHISEGHSMTRINVLGGDSRTSIATSKTDLQKNVISKWIYKQIEKHTCVPLQVGDQMVLANVNSIAKRLHRSTSEVRAAAAQGTLGELMFQQARTTTTVLSGYEQVLNQMQNSSQPNVSKKTMMKTITEGVLKLNNSTEMKAAVTFDLGNRNFSIFSGKTINGTPLIVSERTTLLGEGGFGIVHSLNTPGINAGHAIKKAKPDAHGAINDIQNEVRQLKYLNRNGPVRGLPPDVIAVTVMIPAMGKQVIDGYITEKIDGDLTSKAPQGILPTNAEVLYEFEAPINALCAIHDEKLLHRDVKGGNIFFKGTETFLSDLGGVISAEKLLDSDRRKAISFAYNSEGDFQALELIAENIGARTPTEKEVATLQLMGEQQEIFSMGTTIYQRLLNSKEEFPYPIEGFFVPLQLTGWNHKDPLDETNLKTPKPLPDSVDPDINRLVMSMLHPNLDARPTMREVQAAWSQIQEKEEYREVKEKVSAQKARFN